MIGQLLAKVIGTQNEREIKRLRPLVAEINAFEPSIQPLTDEQLREKTAEFRKRVADGETLHDLLVEAMEALNDREKFILTERRLTDEPKTLEELSQVYAVSRERIRQIEVRAFEKLQAALIRLAGEQRLLPAT